MSNFSKEEVIRYMALPTAIAAVLFYANHCALQRDQQARRDVAAHLKMPGSNPSWADIKERADGMAYIEGLHQRLAKLQHQREIENVKRALRSADAQKSALSHDDPPKMAPTVITLPIPMSLAQ